MVGRLAETLESFETGSGTREERLFESEPFIPDRFRVVE